MIDLIYWSRREARIPRLYCPPQVLAWLEVEFEYIPKSNWECDVDLSAFIHM